MKSFLDGRVILHFGDCADVIKTIPDNSIDAVCTDPPYALVSIVKRFANSPRSETTENIANPYGRTGRGFMGKKWDNGAVAFSVEFWTEVLRVLKPGAHVVAFGGTRTFHRLACAIEDAGFEIRDALMWHFATGFPKSHDVSKGIDKAAGARGNSGSGFNAAGRGERSNGGDVLRSDHPDYVKPRGVTDAARQWEGWGTALKPATEIICLARKPLSEPTIAANVLRWGCGAIHVDACRVGTTDKKHFPVGAISKDGSIKTGLHSKPREEDSSPLSRWPANLCHDNSPEVLAAFPETGPGSFPSRRGSGGIGNDGHRGQDGLIARITDSGNAARFFFSAKAGANDRVGSKHPTVKPVALMQWLCRLICPPGGTILDPFAGTGTTGEAAWREGFNAVLIEREAEYQTDIARRMKHVRASDRERKETIAKTKGRVENAGPLFGEIECT